MLNAWLFLFHSCLKVFFHNPIQTDKTKFQPYNIVLLYSVNQKHVTLCKYNRFWMLTLTLESRFCSFLDSRLFFSTKSTYREEQTVVWDDAMLGWWRLWPVGKQIGLDVCTAGRSSENDHSKCCKSFSVKNEGSTVPNPTAQNLIFGQF